MAMEQHSSTTGPHPAPIPNHDNSTTVFAHKTFDSSFVINIISPLFTLLSSTVNQRADIMNHIPSAPDDILFLTRTAREIGDFHAKVRWSLPPVEEGELTCCA